MENDLAINHGLYLEKEEQLDLLVAANEERVKKLDKLIQKEEHYKKIEFERDHWYVMF